MASRTCPASGFDLTSRPEHSPGGPPLVTGGNAGAGFKDGLPFQPWAAELQKKRAAIAGLERSRWAVPCPGSASIPIDPQPLEIIQTPRKILYISESNYGLRTFYMDGRSLPPLGEATPYWHGYSVGRWDGDTLSSSQTISTASIRTMWRRPASLSSAWDGFDHRGSPYIRGDNYRTIPACELQTCPGGRAIPCRGK